LNSALATKQLLLFSFTIRDDSFSSNMQMSREAHCLRTFTKRTHFIHAYQDPHTWSIEREDGFFIKADVQINAQAQFTTTVFLFKNKYSCYFFRLRSFVTIHPKIQSTSKTFG